MTAQESGSAPAATRTDEVKTPGQLLESKDLDVISQAESVVRVPLAPDSTALLEQDFYQAGQKLDLDTQGKQLELKKKEIDVESASQDVQLRAEFARRIHYILVGYLLFGAAVVALSGLRVDGLPADIWIELSDNVLIALIATAPFNIIGLYAIVVRNLFPQN